MNILEDENPFIHLQFTMTQLPEGSPTPRPLQIQVPNAFNSEEGDTRACLIVKDPESKFKETIQDMKIPCIAEVIGFDRLKREYREFKDKKKLMREYDLFLADIRVYKMLPELLGKEFYAKKMFPCPVKVHGFDKSDDLEK